MNLCFIIKNFRLCVYRDIVIFFPWVSIIEYMGMEKEKK